MKKQINIMDWQLCAYKDADSAEMKEINEKLTALRVSDTHKVMAFENLSNENRGSTIANSTMRKILVLISPQSSREQNINTISHEIRHVVDILCAECNCEDAAHLTGEIAMRFTDWM